MNVPDLRNVDFDEYRRRAGELRKEAIAESVDRAIAAVKALLGPPAVTAPSQGPAAGSCAA